MSIPLSDYSHFFTTSTMQRMESPIRALLPLLSIPNMISLGGGLPNPETFPISSLSFRLASPSGTDLSAETVELSPKELATALQYGPTAGLPELISWLTELQDRVHKLPHKESTSISIGVGSQDLIAKALEVLVNPGDTVLVENPTYAGTLAALQPYRCNILGVETDADGLVPASLEKLLLANPQARVLYTIPSGSNPSGVTTSAERRRAIYDLASKYNILILEDDAYYYLQYGANERPPTYLSMDVNKRVVRFDSASKILSAGIRIGWCTGPKEILNRINLNTMASNLQPPGVTQALLMAILRRWDHSGFLSHCDRVSAFYERRARKFCSLAHKHLDGLVTFSEPKAGMFLWMRLAPPLDKLDTHELVTEKAAAAKVLLVPGRVFMPNGEKDCPSPFVRASFSTATDEEIETALLRFAGVLRGCMGETVG